MSQRVCIIAITAEQVARSAPTDRSIWRVTMMKTMPVAMMATDAVWIVRLKTFRGVRNRPPVMMLNTIAIRMKAPIMPRRRGSISRLFQMDRR